ncbi:membrane protein [Vibrio metoecus]|uniref:Membrane protein n=1 Tax=Vibrio metoecus TaxID=1481663 RepID=A0A0N8VAR6_VIBMT|nr:exopolysaccharide biosynthesis protein VpsF [Vibrio metoecus]KQA21382.1 membrane protein [Vibrio metoecus]KQB01939.1 membrane protein [Vibrio metoecus]
MSERNLIRWIILIVLSAFFLGAFLLENMGVQYVSEGGNPILKIHVYSYFTMIVFVVFSFRFGCLNLFKQLGELSKVWCLAMISIMSVIFYGFMRFGTSGLAYLIDSIFIPLLLVPLILGLSSSAKDSLLSLLAYLIFLNACVAIAEFVLGQSIVAVEIGGFSFFRSTAFLAHPLNNALITASLSLLLMRYTKIPEVLYVSVVILALFAFGGRAALGIFLLGNFMLTLPNLRLFLGEGLRYSKTKFAYMQALVYFSAIAVILTVVFSPIGERILSKLHIDNSAEARFDAFILLEQLSSSEWLFGASHGLLNDIVFYIGINVVENYLIGWVLNFGLLGCIGLLSSTYLVPFMLVYKQGWSAKIVLISFILISVTNNALTVKTPALMFLVMVLSCYYRSSEYRQKTYV